MPAAETGNTGELLVFLNQRVSFARDFFGWNLNFDLAFGIAYSFGWAHVLPFVCRLSVKFVQNSVKRGTPSLVVRQNPIFWLVRWV
jgi:hypothetical protein